MSENPILDSYPCKECQAGVLRLKFITYFTWLDNELVTVPNFPAWVCDVCGRRDYDERAISMLSTLLNPDTGKSPSPRRRAITPAERRDIALPAAPESPQEN
jgi:YgiT-type zinc finger domain-containing protein